MEEILLKLQNSVDFFHDLSLKEIENLVRSVPKKILKKNEFLFKEGSVGNEMYLILSGEVRLYSATYRDEVDLVLDYGQYFGELGLLTRKPRTFSAISNQDNTTLLILNEHQLTKNFALAYRFFKQIVKELSSRTRALNIKYLEKKKMTDRLRAENTKKNKQIYTDQVPIKDVSLEETNFTNLDFLNSNFQNSNLSHCLFKGVQFQQINFHDADFSLTKNQDVQIMQSNLKEMDAQSAHFKKVTFENCRFQDVDFSKVDFEKTKIRKE